MLVPGDSAPRFTLPGDDGRDHSLEELSKKRTLVLYFYPKDNTPGCTTQACEFRDAVEDFSGRGAIVVGVSPDSPTTHVKFKSKHELPFLLLSDPDHKVAKAYGAFGPKMLYGKKYDGIIRSTFVIRSGKIVSVHPKVSPKGHAAAMLAQLETGA